MKKVKRKSSIVIDDKPIDLKNNKNKNKFIKLVFWLVSLVFAIQAFSFKIPYCIVIGFMSLSIGFTIFPFLDDITDKFDVIFSKKNKFFIIGMSFLITAYSLKPDEKNYFRCILPVCLMILVWISTLIYKRKTDERKGDFDDKRNKK